MATAKKNLEMSEEFMNIFSTVREKVHEIDNDVKRTSHDAGNGNIVESDKITIPDFGDKKHSSYTLSGKTAEGYVKMIKLIELEGTTKMHMCFQLSELAKDGGYKQFGIKSSSDMAARWFDIKPAKASADIRMGNAFLYRDEAGNIKMREAISGFGYSQCMELLPLVSSDKFDEYREKNDIHEVTDEIWSAFVEDALSVIGTDLLPINETFSRDKVRDAVKSYIPPKLTDKQREEKEKKENAKAEKAKAETFYKAYSGRLEGIKSLIATIERETNAELEYLDKVNETIDGAILSELLAHFETVKKVCIDMSHMMDREEEFTADAE